MPDHEPGDDYLRRIATFIRTNEKSLAEGGLPRRRAKPTVETASYLNPLGWFGPPATAATLPAVKPIILSIDTHHLFYILMRMEELALPVGTLDVRVDAPSRPMSYINLFPDADKAETLSLASFRSSLSAVSTFSLGGGWWGKSQLPPLDMELKYLYSSFTKLPALSITAPGRHMVAELSNQPPNENALPLDAFKNIQSLECIDIDPRTLLGWDRLAESLRSLKIRKSGLEDISDIFIGAVIDDQARREGSTSRKRHRRIPRGPERQISFYATQLPESVTEDADGEASSQESPIEGGSGSPPPPNTLSSLKWAFLKHLSLADNALAFFPADLIPYFTPLTHLDLSSNLLVSVPSGLGSLYNLVSLNLSDNMIDSVLGIYLNLGQVLYLNLAHNRLDSICGLERLGALERVDLRGNIIDDVAEIGRLAALPNIAEVLIEGNPFTEDEGYRIPCFDFFWKEGKTIALDGTQPSYYEKRGLTVAPPQQMSSTRPVSVAHSPPTVAVGHAHEHYPRLAQPTPPSSNTTSPNLVPVGAIGVVGKARRKKVKRIVDLDGDQSDGSTKSTGHRRIRSDDSRKGRSTPKVKRADVNATREASPLKQWGRFEDILESEKTASTSAAATGVPPRARHSKHTRRQTEYVSSGFPEVEELPATTSSHRSQTLSGRSAARRARVSASVYEPPPTQSDPEERPEEVRDSAEAYRQRIEALKKDMGDGWLKVFSQTQMATSS